MPEQKQPETLDAKTVKKVADLAMLELTDEETDKFSSQLSAILDRVTELRQLDTQNVEPTAHPYELSNVFRDDTVQQNAEVQKQALAAAPETEENQFQVPPALGEQR